VNELLRRYPGEIEHILAKYPAKFQKSAVMPLLYLAQRELGYLTKKQIYDVAEITGLSATDVDSVVGFYSLFHEKAGGRYHLQVCTDLPCALSGAEEFLAKLCENIGVKLGDTTSDGLLTVEAVTCLADCHHAPVFQVQSGSDIACYQDQTVEKAMVVVAGLQQKGDK
jgi:NADH-quinone oxidoreductase subunit E